LALNDDFTACEADPTAAATAGITCSTFDNADYGGDGYAECATWGSDGTCTLYVDGDEPWVTKNCGKEVNKWNGSNDSTGSCDCYDWDDTNSRCRDYVCYSGNYDDYDHLCMDKACKTYWAPVTDGSTTYECKCPDPTNMANTSDGLTNPTDCLLTLCYTFWTGNYATGSCVACPNGTNDTCDHPLPWYKCKDDAAGGATANIDTNYSGAGTGNWCTTTFVADKATFEGMLPSA